jgi:hypothetical protein
MSLTAIQVPYGDFAFFPIPTGLDSETPPQSQPINGETAAIDNYAAAYVALSGANVYCVARQNQLPQGGTLTVNVTLNAKSADGTALAPTVQPVTFTGPPAPPQASTINVTGQQVGAINGNGSNVPADPGAASIAI